jgi:hypothetical protein
MASGAWSPPIASTAIFIFDFLPLEGSKGIRQLPLQDKTRGYEVNKNMTCKLIRDKVIPLSMVEIQINRPVWTGINKSLDGFNLYDFFILVISAVRTNMVRSFNLMALRTFTVSRST